MERSDFATWSSVFFSTPIAIPLVESGCISVQDVGFVGFCPTIGMSRGGVRGAGIMRVGDREFCVQRGVDIQKKELIGAE